MGRRKREDEPALGELRPRPVADHNEPFSRHRGVHSDVGAPFVPLALLVPWVLSVVEVLYAAGGQCCAQSRQPSYIQGVQQ